MAARKQGTDAAPRVRLDGEIRQQQIVEACARLIARRGYAATSMRDVAAEAGISTGTLMHHFHSKDDLLTATLLSVADGFMKRSEAAIARAKDPEGQLRSLLRAMLATRDEVDIGWRVWIAFWHESALKPELARVAATITERSEASLAQLIAAGIDEGRFAIDEPEERASQLAALIDGVAIRVYGEAGRWSHRKAVAVIDGMIDEWTSDATAPATQGGPARG